MAGSGVPFARHQGLQNRPLAESFVTGEPFALRKAVRVGPHSFSKNDLRKMLRVNPNAVNPLTRQPLPNRVKQRYLPSADNFYDDIENTLLGELRQIVAAMRDPRPEARYDVAYRLGWAVGMGFGYIRKTFADILYVYAFPADIDPRFSLLVQRTWLDTGEVALHGCCID
jgi:hypothetical protein